MRTISALHLVAAESACDTSLRRAVGFGGVLDFLFRELAHRVDLVGLSFSLLWFIRTKDFVEPFRPLFLSVVTPSLVNLPGKNSQLTRGSLVR